jgi:AcrR family transcriptional regulator
MNHELKGAVMPKPTFFRLPDEKRQRLMDAAVQEFTRAPFAKASVSNIIQTAGIPRGSFYQYFEDKQDIFFYMLEQLGNTMGARMETIIEENDGQLMLSIRKFFNYVIDSILNGEHGKLFQNIFVYMDFRSASHTVFGGEKDQHDKHVRMRQQLMSRVDFTALKIDSEQDLYLLMRTAMGILMQSITHYYNAIRAGREVEIAEIHDSVNKCLDWLEQGVAK